MTAIGNYFRTALLIDDRAVDTAADLESSGPISADSEPTPGLVETPSESTPLHWNDIVNAFLEEEVVCSVLRPDKLDRADREDNILDIAILGSRIADLLILDWDLFNDDGEVVKGAIREIAKADPRQLKVIVVYTEKSLAAVVDALVKECGLTEKLNFVFSKEATVVLVFRKSGIKPMEGEEESNRTASYLRLPTMIREDLEEYFGGLVPELAFSGINIIRESAPRVLATFAPSLDAPLLTHRALLPEVSDVRPQFIRLLTSEFEAALMESPPLAGLLNEEYISERLDDLEIIESPKSLVEELRKSPNVEDELKSLDDTELAKRAVAMGLRRLGLGDARLDKLLIPLAETFGVDEEPHKLLAALMSSTRFGDISPRLEAGIVLKNEDEYWLCIQPLCDSVRLTGSRKFPLLPLVVNADKDDNVKRNSDAMIRAADGTTVPVRFCSHSYELTTSEFAPEKGDSSVQAQLEKGTWYFCDTDEKRYNAVCRLKDEFTQQAVQKLTSGVTRPGVDLSEWLRRSDRS